MESSPKKSGPEEGVEKICQWLKRERTREGICISLKKGKNRIWFFAAC